MPPRFRIPNTRKMRAPSIPVRPKPMFVHQAPSVVTPPVPVVNLPVIRPEQVGPVRPPTAPRTVLPPTPMRPKGYNNLRVVQPRDVPPARPMPISADMVGPVGVTPEVPDWVKEEAKLRPPEVRTPVLPPAYIHEGRFGIKVKEQPSDYVRPPVTTPTKPIHRNEVAPAPSDDVIYHAIEGQMRPRYEPKEMTRGVELKDLGLDLLKGTSKYAGGIGQTHGRLVGEGIL